MSKVFDWLKIKISPLTKDEQKQLLLDLEPGAQPGFDYFLLVVLSTTIATLGLMTDSAAVIIGAMLLAPLMTPIIMIGLTSVVGNTNLLRRSTITLVEGIGVSIGLSILITLSNRFMPFIGFQELSSEIIARTHPSPLDLTIALAGGLAGAYALTRKTLSATLPGVAIATALMPPLCTIGIGIALGRWSVAGGAILLFLTNAVTIAFASAVVFFVRGFRPRLKENNHLIPKNLLITASLTIILLIPLTFFSIKFFRDSNENRQINSVTAEAVFSLTGAELSDLQMYRSDDVLQITVTVRTFKPISHEQVVALQEILVERLNRPVSLKVNQVFAQQLDPLDPPTPTPTPSPTATPHPLPSPTPSPSHTATSTITVTPSPSPTATNTSTPVSGFIARAEAVRLQLYQTPGGPPIGQLRYNQPIFIWPQTQVFNGYVWRLIQDGEGRIGWIPEIYIQTISLTGTITP